MNLGIIMDPIDRINIKKDSSFAMLLAAKARGWNLFYMELSDLCLVDDSLLANMSELEVFDDPRRWVQRRQAGEMNTAELDFILLRKDPPFDVEYIYATYLLDHAVKQGTPVFNDPTGIRNANEKLFISHFSDCITATQVCRTAAQIKSFISKHGEIILKPLGGMGGASIFKTGAGDNNLNVIIETLTANETRFVMAQKYIPEINRGDKRILLIDGEAVPYGLARLPAAGETRGNLAKGGTGRGSELSERDRRICERVGPVLKQNGLIFVGLDVIGDYLTEINVTSPTCIRELDAIYGIDIAARLMDAIANRLRA